VTADLSNTSRLLFNPNTLTIPAGSLSQDVQLTLIDNNIDEPDQSVQAILSNVSNATASQPLSVTISDNDTPSTLTFNGATADVIEGNTSTIVFTLDRISGYNITVPLTISGTVDQTDYSFNYASALIPKGESQITLPLTILDDTHAEGLETFILTTTVGTQYQLGNTQTTLSIIDNEGVFGVSQFGSGIWLDTQAKGTWGSTEWK
jgi:hypothetical protein